MWQPLLHPYHQCYKKASAAGNLLWLYNIWAWNYIFSFTTSDWYSDWYLLRLYRCLMAFSPIAQSSLLLLIRSIIIQHWFLGKKRETSNLNSTRCELSLKFQDNRRSVSRAAGSQPCCCYPEPHPAAPVPPLSLWLLLCIPPPLPTWLQAQGLHSYVVPIP